MYQKFVTSVYWATVTCTTVGYGDITPTNNYELIWAMAIIIVGVCIFSYFLSDLSSNFSDLVDSAAKNQVKIDKLYELQETFGIDTQSIDKIETFLEEQLRHASLDKNLEVINLLKVLPPTLQNGLAKCVFRDMIRMFPMLQNRDECFYGRYLTQMQSRVFYLS